MAIESNSHNSVDSNAKRGSQGQNRKLISCEKAQVQLSVPDGLLPLTVGIEVPGGRTQPVLTRGIRLPHTQTEIYSTVDAYQTAMEFHIVLGERPLARDNMEVARIRVRNVKWSNAGTPKIEIAFDVSKEGLLSISTANKDKKSTEMLALVTRPTVSEADIAAALADASNAKKEDELVRANIETMLSGYRLLDQAYERYSIAKRHMGFGKKREYKNARNRLQKALNVLPYEATSDTMAELRLALGAFREAYNSIEKDYQAVMGWWKQ